MSEKVVNINEEQLKEIKQIVLDQISTIEKNLDEKASNPKLTEKMNKLNAAVEQLNDFQGKGVTTYIKGLQEHCDQLDSRVKELTTKGAERIGTFKSEVKEVTRNENWTSQFKNRQGTEIEIKADLSTSSFSAEDANTIKLPENRGQGVAQPAWTQNPVWNNSIKISSSGPFNRISWTEENARTDNAGIKAEGSAASQSDITLIQRSEPFYVISHYATMSQESMEDSDVLAGVVNDLLTNGVFKFAEQQLTTGTGSSQMEGIFTAKKTFAKPSTFDTVTAPNIFDLLRAASLQCKIGNNASDSNKMGYVPTIAIVPVGTLDSVAHRKDSNSNYIMDPFRMTNGMMFNGMMILESFDIDQGSYMVYDSRLPRVYVKRNITLSTSDNVASNFLSDQIVVKAGIRAAHVIKTNEKFGIVGGTIEAGLAEITA